MSSIILAAALINAAGVVILGMSRANWPRPDFWQPPWVVAALVITGVTPFVQAALAERGERSRRKAVEGEAAIEAFLVASLVYVVRHCRADWEKTGIQAFVVKSRWWFWQHQVRLARVRLSPMPTSGISWGKGKGVIGRCWQTRANQVVGVESHFAEYGNLTEVRWDALPSEGRFGLTFDDFQHLKGKYGWILAVPVIGRNDKYIGCITLDTPPGHTHLRTGCAIESLSTTAALVAEYMDK